MTTSPHPGDDGSGPPAAETLAALQDALARCEHDRRAMAMALVATCRELDAARQALQDSLGRELEARQLIGHDALTGLPNRVAFGQRSSRTLAAHAEQRRSFGLLFVDLDGFKAVNDALGHAAGDELLAIVGARLAHALRQGDFVSRHGGDEFVCLLPRLDRVERAQALARKLIEVISAPCQLADATVRIGASVGVALFPLDGQSVAALLERADQAMLRAKAQGLGVGLASLAPATPARDARSGRGFGNGHGKVNGADRGNGAAAPDTPDARDTLDARDAPRARPAVRSSRSRPPAQPGSCP